MEMEKKVRRREFRLSPSQFRAVRAGTGESLVTAAAGSGKTRVLIEHFLSWVLQKRVPADRLVAITFTQDAANEMKRRLFEALRKCGREDQIPLLDRGNVATIDSFCRSLLKTYAVDAGIDPEFTVLDEDLAELLQNEILDRVFEETMFETKYDRIFGFFGPDRLRKSLLRVYEKWRAGSCDLTLSTADTGLVELKKRAVEEALEELREVQDDHLPEGSFLAQVGAVTDEDEILSLVRDLAKAAKSADARKKATKDLAYSFRERIDDLRKTVIDVFTDNLTGPFLDLVKQFDREYTRHKEAQGLLDFHDLLHRSLLLVEQPLVCARIQSDFPLVLVDEYQDINALQSKFVEKIAGGRHAFYVGDVRQSIYGFRHADCRIFLQKLSAARRKGSRLKLLPLQENFRAKADLVGFVNFLFEKKEVACGYSYGRMDSFRKKRPGERPCIEVLADRSGARGRAQVLKEAEAISRRIHSMVEDERMRIQARDQRSREVRYGDIAILIPTRTNIELYEAMLRTRDIPYYLVKGKGFYDKTEVMDMLNALRALFYPADDLALMACAKSPLGGISDEGLYRIRRRSKGSSFYDALLADLGHYGLDPRDNENAVRFREWFRTIAERKHRMRVSEIIESILLLTHYDAIVLAMPEGKRRYLNLMKLKSKARNYDEQWNGGPERFVRFLEGLRNEEIEEPEASLEAEEDNAVKVMTVHGAKGLEFPVVFLAGISDERNSVHFDFLLTDSSEIVCGIPSLPGREFLKGHRFERAMQDAVDREKEEYARLLYVALTRCTEYLACCGAFRPISDGEGKTSYSWADWFVEKMPELADHETVGVINRGGVSVMIRSEAEGVPPQPPTSFDAEKMLQPSHSDLARSRFAPSRLDCSLPPLWRPVPAYYYQTVDLTVSQIVALRGGFKTSPLAGVAAQISDDDDRESSALDFGKVYHSVLQHLDMKKNLRREIGRLLNVYGGGMSTAVLEELRRQLERFLSSPEGLSIREAVKRDRPVYRELPFLYRISDKGTDLGFLVGQVDLLYENERCEWVLLDYKTGTARRDEDVYQLQLYGFCLQDLLGSRIHRAVLYYSGSGEFLEASLKDLGGAHFYAEVVDLYAAGRQQALGRTEGTC